MQFSLRGGEGEIRQISQRRGTEVGALVISVLDQKGMETVLCGGSLRTGSKKKGKSHATRKDGQRVFRVRNQIVPDT